MARAPGHDGGQYYLACNVGNIMGEFGGPVLREYVSYFSVMLAVAIAQVAGSLFFWMGRKTYRMVPPQVSSRFAWGRG